MIVRAREISLDSKFVVIGNVFQDLLSRAIMIPPKKSEEKINIDRFLLSILILKDDTMILVWLIVLHHNNVGVKSFSTSYSCLWILLFISCNVGQEARVPQSFECYNKTFSSFDDKVSHRIYWILENRDELSVRESVQVAQDTSNHTGKASNGNILGDVSITILGVNNNL